MAVALEHSTGLLAVFEFLGYRVVRLANRGFYSHLRVRPEEISLGYAEILASAVTGILIFFLSLVWLP